VLNLHHYHLKIIFIAVVVVIIAIVIIINIIIFTANIATVAQWRSKQTIGLSI